MNPQLNTDPTIYGGEAAPTTPVPYFDPASVGAAQAARPAPAPVDPAGMAAGLLSVQEGQQAIRAANRPVASYGESAMAAVKSMATARLFDWYKAPSFTPADGFDVKPYISNAPVSLTEAEHRFLAVSRSPEEFGYKLDNLQAQRKLNEQMGDHPVLAGIISFADPVYLGIDIASAGLASGVSRGLQFGRAAERVLAASSSFGATFAVGKAEQSVVPLTDGDIITNALINGAASATFINPVTRRFEKVDPKFPDEALMRAAKGEAMPDPVETAVKAEAADATEFARTRPTTPQQPAAPVVPEVPVATPVVDTAGKAVPRPVDAPAAATEAVAPAVAVDPVVSLPATLSKASPNYAIGQKQFKVAFDSDLDRAAYIVSGKGKSKSHDAYVKWAESTGQDLGALQKRGEAIRAELKTQAATAQGKELRIGKAAATSDAPNPSLMIPGSVSDDALRRYGATNLSDPFDAYTALARHEADADFGPMIRTLRKEHGEALAQVRTREGDVSHPFYSHNDSTVYLHRKANAFEALHESIHGLTVNKIAYGKAHPDTAHGRLVQELEALRAEVAARVEKVPAGVKGDFAKDTNKAGASYYTQNLEEFVAGLYAGRGEGLVRLMANMPASGSRNALTKMVGIVRKLLGISGRQESVLTKALGINDELMRIKLDVSNEAGDMVASFAPSGTPSQIGKGVASWWNNSTATTTSGKAASKMEWSLNRNLTSRGTEGERVAKLLVDDPINMTGDSAVSQRGAIRNDLTLHQVAFEESLKDVLAERGAGLRQRIFQSGKAMEIQQGVEREVAGELARRENAVRRGQPLANPNVDPKIAKLADLHDVATARALDEMKSAQVRGADTIQTGAGYATRKWDVTKLETAEGEFLAAGATEAQARKGVRDLVSAGIQKANGSIPKDMADDMAQAITERTRRKGYFEDMPATGAMGDDGAQAVRALLAGSGISPQRMRLVEEFLTGRKDDEGLMSSLKHRIPMDMTASVNVNGRDINLLDLTDTSLTRTLDSYLDDAAGQAGLARKGLADNSDIVKLRGEFLGGIASEAERREAASLFDNTIKAIKGQPVGEEMNKGMRQLSAVTTSVGLANSGLWQMMEYANIAAKYGMVKTAKEVLARMPGTRALMSQVKHNADEAGSMAHVLSEASAADLRLRPFVAKMEDNFSIPVDERATLALQQAKQLVPYLNAMKFVHTAQARLTGNLITDTFARGAKGDKGAREALARYGLEGHQLDALRAEIAQHGLKVDDWSAGAWDSVRGPLNKMMDDAVLKNRTGELPAFAQFSTLGKFIFTYRSFVLGAHNKVLAGTLGRHGFAGLGLLMAYQFPLAMMSTAAVNAARGKWEDDPEKVAVQAVGQMSAFGLLTELWGVASGDKKQFGAPGLMAIDRLYKTGSQAAQGNFGGAGANLLNSVPLLAIMPGVKAMAEQLKD